MLYYRNKCLKNTIQIPGKDCKVVPWMSRPKLFFICVKHQKLDYKYKKITMSTKIKISKEIMAGLFIRFWNVMGMQTIIKKKQMRM